MVTRRRFLAGCATVPLLSWLNLNTAFADTPPSMLVMAMQLDNMTSLDPQEGFEAVGTEIIGNLYQRLVMPNPANPQEVIGDLAVSWEVGNDSKTFTFHLNPKAKFADGSPVTADDAAFSLQRAVKLDKSPAFIINQFGFTKDNVEQHITAPDEKTLVINLDKPAAETFLLYCLSAPVGSIVQKKAALANQQNNDLGNQWLKQNSAGSGPFSLVSWKASESIILQKNDHFPADNAFKRVLIKHIVDPSAQLLMLQKGDVDIARNLTTEQIRPLVNDSNYHLVRQSIASVMLLSCNTGNEFLKKPQVWQAIKWALDYDSIQKNILPLTHKVHQSFLPGGFPAALDDTPFHLDVAKAKALLKDAGYPDGFDITLDHYSAQPYPDIAQAVQTQLGAIGIRVKLIAAENRQVLTKMRARQQQLALTAWGADYFDPNSNAEAFCINTDNSDGARNRTLAWRCNWSDEKFNQLTEQALHEQDPAKRIALYETLQRNHREQSPFTLMMQDEKTLACRKNLSGVTMTVLSKVPYQQVKKA
ncbi:ABC transporter substrate-binding protein [Dickeya solani]|uniref:Dipeptide ABC transporter, peptide-binding protein n=1 Tax=Dickeya solani D s0432-1 TaxID=1231725 RepID=A0AAV3KF68_9GAMM|nr:ABC transporter substrate-binding protein [Dickeya solani]ANE75601.1 peptide ABC transporter substrate-binding protein [Dickeya solani IPO 2222]AUC43055.1 Dipeptide-binding ABC transporter, periplasmic substrate-binding component [Dickeya solani RNS 08.23.3.1.A]AUH08986.1 peptide ABC transporter substrate-binding protein [Dickeya solani D s0432-1]AUH12967.1 peptide ABC transporter substrate-binding protein [Dickeya solani]AYQ46006.1 putative D,D-dipeptide-binding periplasmic protein DdpA pr